MAPLTIPKIFMAGGAVGFTYYMVMRQYWFPNPYKTRGVQNIEDRYTAAGGTPTHLPAAGTKTGSPDTESRQMGESKGPPSEFFKEKISSQQSLPVWPEKFYEQQYNNPKGK